MRNYNYLATHPAIPLGGSQLLIANPNRFGFSICGSTTNRIWIWPEAIGSADGGYAIDILARHEFLYKDFGPIVSYDWFAYSPNFMPQIASLIELIYK